MRYILTLMLIIFTADVFAQNVFNPVVIDDYKALDTKCHRISAKKFKSKIS